MTRALSVIARRSRTVRADRLRRIDALILHSPLVGPTTTRALASALSGHGWTTVAPDLRTSLSSPLTYAAAATRAAANVDVLVGHSGAGAMLPVIAHDVEATLTVYVDAIVPEATTTFTTSDQLIALLDQLPIVDGRLPPWHEWWPAEILTQLVPDRRLRDALTAENPRLSRAFYDEPVPLPELWWTRRAGFLQLSPAYDDDRARAEQLGWPTTRIGGQHLDLLSQPGDVADAVVSLTATLLRQNE
jgi:hypothetical protein